MGDSPGALAVYKESIGILRELMRADPNNYDFQRDLEASLDQLGAKEVDDGDIASALKLFQEFLDVAIRVAIANPMIFSNQISLSLAFDRAGDMAVRKGDNGGALLAYQNSFNIREALWSNNEGISDVPSSDDKLKHRVKSDLSVSAIKIGNVKLRMGDVAGGLKSLQKSVQIDRELATSDPENAEAQRSLAISIEWLSAGQSEAADRRDAIASQQESLEIRRQLSRQDASNTQKRHDISISLNRLCQLKRDYDWKEALIDCQESYDIFKDIASRDPGSAQAQHDVAGSLAEIGDLKLTHGDEAGAFEAYAQSLDIHRHLILDKIDKDSRVDLLNIYTNAAFAALMCRKYDQSLLLTDESISIDPETIAIFTNRAHALMLLGHTKEAKAIYLKYVNKIVQNGKSWQKSIKEDFDAFRKKGINNPLMGEIEADFAKIPQILRQK